MRYINREELPEAVIKNELSSEDDGKYKNFNDDKYRSSGGFADALFLGAVMLVCFMWGMLAVILW